MASPCGPGGGTTPQRTSSSGLMQQPPLYSSIEPQPRESFHSREGIDDDISMITTDKVYLLTHTDNRTVHSLQIYDADEISEELYQDIQDSSGLDYTYQMGNRERIDMVEDVKFGFGLTFRLAGLCETVQLHYHESILIKGQYYSGYSEYMGEFGRLDHVEKAYYYCPRESRFQNGTRNLKGADLEISIRTSLGVELFSRRWKLQILPKSQLNTLNLGEATLQVEVTPSKSPQSESFSNLRNSHSSDSIISDSFVDIESEEMYLVDSKNTKLRQASTDSIAMPRNPEAPNMFEQVGIWLYGSKLGQYVARNFDPASSQRRIKESFTPEPIWLLGNKFDLKPTNLIGFNPISLSPAKSSFKLNFSRCFYEGRAQFYRKEVYRCLGMNTADIMTVIGTWAKSVDLSIKHQNAFGITFQCGNSDLTFKVFSYDGLVLEIDLRCDPKHFPSLPLSLLASAIKELGIRNNLIVPLSFVSEWSGNIFNPPESDIAHLVFTWSPSPSTDRKFEDCFVWDSLAQEWILGFVSVTDSGDVLVASKIGGFVALEGSMANLTFRLDSDHLVLRTDRGKEYYLLITNIQTRSSLSAKFYLLSSRSYGQKPRSAVLDFRKNFQLQRIHQSLERKAELQRRHALNRTIVQDFVMDFESRFWFTYRRDMPRIANTLLNTDAGWGCMIRCGQMMLGEAYSRILLGRGWNHMFIEVGGILPEMYMSILRLFEDRLSNTAPYGFHSLVLTGASIGHPIGQWFNPTLLSRVCAIQSQKIHPKHLVVLPIDNGVFNVPIIKSMVALQPVLLMVPMMLGIETFNPVYLDLVTGSLEIPQSVGIIGGRPGKCFHIVAHQKQKELFYLDPHFTREPVTDLHQAMVRHQFHTTQIAAMEPAKLDPTVMLGFILKEPSEVDGFMQAIIRLNMSAPVFSIVH